MKQVGLEGKKARVQAPEHAVVAKLEGSIVPVDEFGVQQPRIVPRVGQVHQMQPWVSLEGNVEARRRPTEKANVEFVVPVDGVVVSPNFEPVVADRQRSVLEIEMDKRAKHGGKGGLPRIGNVVVGRAQVSVHDPRERGTKYAWNGGCPKNVAKRFQSIDPQDRVRAKVEEEFRGARDRGKHHDHGVEGLQLVVRHVDRTNAKEVPLAPPLFDPRHDSIGPAWPEVGHGRVVSEEGFEGQCREPDLIQRVGELRGVAKGHEGLDFTVVDEAVDAAPYVKEEVAQGVPGRKRVGQGYAAKLKVHPTAPQIHQCIFPTIDHVHLLFGVEKVVLAGSVPPLVGRFQRGQSQVVSWVVVW